MAHYIKDSIVYEWLKTDVHQFMTKVDDEGLYVRMYDDEGVTYYHSVDIHRLLMKHLVDLTSYLPTLEQLNDWSNLNQKLHEYDVSEKSDDVIDSLDEMIRLVDMNYGAYYIMSDYIQPVMIGYISNIARLCDDYQIDIHSIQLTQFETIDLPKTLHIKDELMSDELIHHLQHFDGYRLLGLLKSVSLEDIYYSLGYDTWSFVRDILYYLHLLLKECIKEAKALSPLPIMIHIDDLAQWSDEMIAILFNVSERRDSQ